MSGSPGLQIKHSVPNKKGETDELRCACCCRTNSVCPTQSIFCNCFCLGMCRLLLRAPENLKDQKRYLQAVQKVIAYMTIGVDVSKLFSDMIMVSAGMMLEGRRSSRDLHVHVT